MSRTTRFAIVATVTKAASLALLVAAILAGPAHAIGTSFTYQGQIKKNGAPYTGNATFTFDLMDAASGGNMVAQNGLILPVTNGLFTAELDFGPVFNGAPRWLEIRVLTGGENYTLLTPRQEIKSVPYALRSVVSESGGASQWQSGTTGIFYLGGNVAIGQTSETNSDRRFVVNTGTANANPGWFKNNTANYATLVVQNDALGGIGLYDQWSDRHYLAGYLGIGTLNPTSPFHAITTTQPSAIRGEYTGSFGNGNAGVVGVNNSLDVNAAGVWGTSFFGAGVRGDSQGGDGVFGTASNSNMAGGHFTHTGGGPAIFSDGLAKVRTLQIIGGADLVEGFDTKGDAAREPGTVVVIDEKNAGGLRASDAAYDRKVAGVVSGAGGVEAGIRLGQEGKLDGETLVAMTGRVYVKCSSENGAIQPGDLLTTSATSGHAMRATDHDLANGAVIGKAMSSLDARTGLVLVLVNLQ